MRYRIGLGLVTLGMLGCAPPSVQEEPGRIAQANFVNGGFELGNFNNWTAPARYQWGDGTGAIGFAAFPPRTFTDLNLTANQGQLLTTIVTAGVPTELTAADSLRLPFSGVDAAKVNAPIPAAAPANLGTHNANVLAQSMVTTVADVDPTDGKIHVRFAAAPVLHFPNPAHNPNQQPYFFIEVRNTTKGNALYNTFNFSNQPGVLWKMAAAQVGGQDVLYTDWESFDLAPGPSGIEVGDTIQATVVGTACSFNAHFGEVYVDEFGTSFPYPNVNVSAPTFVNWNTDLTYTITAKNNGTGSATNVIVDFTTPPIADSNLAGAPAVVQTTYVGKNAPGANCNAPTVASPLQTLTCNVGDLGPGGSYTFTVTVHVPVMPGGHVAPDFVNAGLYDIKTDQRPTPNGGGLVQTQVTATNVVGLQTVITDGKSSTIWGAADTYTLTVTNFGPAVANAVPITDTRPAQLAAPTVGSPWTCATGGGGGVCGAASGSGNINTTANLPVGGSVVYTIPTAFTAGPLAPATVTYRATALAPAGTQQSTLFNNLGVDVDTVSNALFVLTITKDPAGSGTGTVTSFPLGISCGGTCAASYAQNTQVALTALPAAGSVFTGWTGGGCAQLANPCTVTVAAATGVTARFDKPVLTTSLNTTSNGGSQNVRPGDTATFNVKVAVPAAATAMPVKVSDIFPANFAYSTSSVPTTTGAVTCSPNACTAPVVVSAATSTIDFGNVTCTTAGPCEINFTITGRVGTGAARGDTIVDQIGATLMGTQNQATLTVIEPNLTVSRTAAPNTNVARGSAVTVTVTLANNTGGANSTAFDEVVTFPIPAGYAGGTFAVGTCPPATATFTGGNATVTFTAGAGSAIASGATCSFSYQVTGNANATGNATATLAAGTATSKSLTGAAPPAKGYSANGAAITFDTAPIANGGNCAAGAECVSVVCDADNKCGYADTHGPCTAQNGATVCRSAFCSQNGLCEPSGQCFVDADCLGTQFCNTVSHACAPKLPNDTAVPTIGGHAPPLTGMCNAAVAAAVCESGACDSDDKCGYLDGDGPCAVGTVCRSGFCSTTGVCGPTGGCLADQDCDVSAQFCNTGTKACVPKLPNDTGVPTIGGHTPPLDGRCSTLVGQAVCSSGVCDAVDDRCGYADGDGSCDQTTAAAVCRSGACKTTGICGLGCRTDADCDVSEFCDTSVAMCRPKVDNGQEVPGGSCTGATGKAACKSGVCDPTDNMCGYAGGNGQCTETAAAACRSGVCGTNGACAPPGTTFAFTGGGLSCGVAGRQGGPDASPLLVLAALLFARSARRRERVTDRGPRAASRARAR